MGAGAPAHLAFPPLPPNDPARFAALSRRNTSGRSSSPPSFRVEYLSYVNQTGRSLGRTRY